MSESSVLDLDVIIDLTSRPNEASKRLVVSGVPQELRAWASQQKIGASSTTKGLQATLSAAIAWAAAIALGSVLPSTLGLIVGWVIIFFVLFRVQNLLHEAAHRGVFSSTWANDVTNALVGAVFFAPGAAYRAYHFVHHGYTRTEGKDPERFYEMVKSRTMLIFTVLAGGIAFSLTMIAGTLQCLVGFRPSWVTSDRVARNVRWQGLASLAISVVAVAGLVSSGLTPLLVRWWLAPVAVFLCGPFTWMTFFEHSGAQRDAQILVSSGTVRSNRFFSWIILNGNFHLAHHVMPTTSWWNLPALDREIRDLEATATADYSATLHTGFFAFHKKLWKTLPWL